MGRRILGLDIGAETVRAVLIDSAYRSWAVVDHAARAVPPAAENGPAPRERQAEAVRELLADRGWAFESAVVSLPGAASSHALTLPFADPRRIEQTIAYEVEAQIPFDLADVAWDWQTLGVHEGRSEILAAVVRREELAGLLAALGAAGVDPRAVIPPAAAYAALHDATALEGDGPAHEPGAVDLVVDVGADRTSFAAVAGGGSLEWARTMPLAARDLARGPAPLVRELRATVKAWRARFPEARTVRRVRLAGEAAGLPGLREAISAELGAPAEPLALTGAAAAAIAPADAPRYALALALALRTHVNRRGDRLNLRRGDLAYTRDFQHVRGKVVRLAAWAALIVLLALVSAGVKSYALSRREKLLDRALCDATQRLLGKCYDDFTIAESVLRGRGSPAAAIPRTSAVDVLDELTRLTPADVQLKFDRVEITRDKLHLQGTTDAAENVDRIVSGLRAGKCFADARSGGVRRRGNETRFEFTIDAGLTCDGAAAAPLAGRGS